MGEPRGSPPTGVGVCVSVHMGVGIWWWVHGPHGLGGAASVGVCICQSWGPGGHLRLSVCVCNPRVCWYMAVVCVCICVYVRTFWGHVDPSAVSFMCICYLRNLLAPPCLVCVYVCMRTAYDVFLTCMDVLLSASWGVWACLSQSVLTRRLVRSLCLYVTE